MLKIKHRAIIAGDIASLEEVELAERKLKSLGVLQKNDQIKLINTIKALRKQLIKDASSVS